MRNILILSSIIFFSSFIEKDADKNISAQKSIPMIYFDNIKGNILYLGIQTPLTIHVNNIDKPIEVKTSSGTLTSLGGGHYYITPSEQGILYLTVLLDGNDISTFQYRIQIIPNPIAKIDNVESGSVITTKDIKESKGIQTVLMDFNYEINYETLSFIFTKINSNGKKTSIINTGAAFSDDIKEELKNCIAGDVVIFDSIKVKNSADNFTRRIPNIVYFVQ